MNAAPESERAIIQLLLLYPERWTDVEGKLAPGDFSDGELGLIWTAMTAAVERYGTYDDFIMLPIEGVSDGLQGALINEQVAAIGLLDVHIERVVLSSRKRKLEMSLRAAGGRLDRGVDLATVRAELDDAFDAVEDVGSLPKGYQPYDTYAAKGEDEQLPWIIPGVLRRQGRAMVVAGEGHSKSTLGRQVAACTAAGLHPFRLDDIEPRRVLVVDAENSPLTAIDEHGGVDPASPLGIMLTLNRQRPNWNRDNLRVWETDLDGLFDFRTSRTQCQMHAILNDFEPDLVVIGPIYKMYQEVSGEKDSVVASDLQRVMDRFRLRHNAAWWIEHHAPLAQNGSRRELRPIGTSLWQRWVDIGLTLEPTDNPRERRIGRFRTDRYDVGGVPEFLDFGITFPFAGRWTNGALATTARSRAIALVPPS